MSLYTDGSYLESTQTWHTEDSAWKAAQISKMIRKHSLRPATVCEVGCGAGEILRVLQGSLSPDTDFTGYDISADAIRMARSRENEHLHFKQEDFTQDGISYDLLLMMDVVEHVEDPFSFVRATKAKATYKIYHIPLELSVSAVWRMQPLLHARAVVGHIHHFSTETALALLKDTGHEIVDHFYTRGAIELERQGLKTRIANLPRLALELLGQGTAQRLLGGYSLLVLCK